MDVDDVSVAYKHLGTSIVLFSKVLLKTRVMLPQQNKKLGGGKYRMESIETRTVLEQARTLRTRNARERVASLTDSKLLAELESLHDTEHKTTVEIILHLEQIESRKLHLTKGFPSLFDYVLSLGYSRGAAGRRLTAARCIRNFPEIYPLLLGQEVTLSTISVFAPVLTQANKEELLPKVCNCSRRRVEEIIADYRPREEIRDQISVLGNGEDAFITDEITRSAGGLELAPRYKLEFEVDGAFLEQLEEIQELLSNKFPRGAKLDEVFSVLMGEYEERHSPEKKAAKRAKRQALWHAKQALKQNKPNKKGMTKAKKVIAKHDSQPSEPEQRRYIPALIKETVSLRDGGRCTFIGTDGRRCNTKRCLEYDHINPLALGGQTEIGNIRLLCRCHNVLEAERKLGWEFMQRFGSHETQSSQDFA